MQSMGTRCLAAAAVLFLTALAFAEEEAKTFPEPIVLGELAATPALASIRHIPLKAITGTSQSKDELFLFAVLLQNRSSTRRVEFLGWPEPHSFGVNLDVRDEHGNRYKAIDFGLGSRPALDEAGETIEPGGSRQAVIVWEAPIKLANLLTVDLDGAAIGQPGKRLRWKIKRADWENDSPEPKKKPAAAPPARPRYDPRIWTSGTFATEATFAGMLGDNVRLRKADGSYVTVPLARLSESDHAWIREHVRGR